MLGTRGTWEPSLLILQLMPQLVLVLGHQHSSGSLPLQVPTRFRHCEARWPPEHTGAL